MFDFKVVKEFKDGSCEYDVVLDKSYTLNEFIETVRSRVEYGYMHIQKKSFGEDMIEFKLCPGESSGLCSAILNRKVLCAISQGYQGRMCYYKVWIEWDVLCEYSHNLYYKR